MKHLEQADVDWCERGLPQRVASLLMKEQGRVVVAGGYIRSRITGEEVKDIDLFVSSRDAAKSAIEFLTGRKYVESENAYTCLAGDVLVQVVHRWEFPNPHVILEHFDFTIARAALWFANRAWIGLADANFYQDVAARRLNYTNPPDPEPGGSLLRALKFSRRGYNAPLQSLADIVAGIYEQTIAAWDGSASPNRIEFAGLVVQKLRLIDPLLDPRQIAAFESEEAGEDRPTLRPEFPAPKVD